MRLSRKWVVCILVGGSCLGYLWFPSSLAVSGAESAVFIDPVSQLAGQGESFFVNVRCVAEQPIKSFELKLSFDPILLVANNVSEGDIFAGFTTFFNAGIIDNTAGTIVDVYDLIIGLGNVSISGTFVTISLECCLGESE